MINLVVILEPTLGGTRRYCLDVLSRIDYNHFKITFIYSLYRTDTAFLNGLKELKKMDITLVEINMVREINLLEDIKSFLKLFRYLRGIKYSIIHLHSSKAGFLGRIVSSIVNPNAFRIYQPHMLSIRLNKKYYIFEKIASYFTDLIVTDSISEAKYIQQTKLISPHKIYSINTGVELNQKLNHIKKNGNVIVGAISRLSYPKDPFTLIDAAKIITKEYKNIQFFWVGEGDLLDRAKAMVHENNLDKYFDFLGWQEDVNYYYSLMDIFVHSTYYEAFGYVVAEAMSFSNAVVASNVPGIHDLVEDGKTGYVFTSGNPNILSELLLILIKNKKIRDEMGREGKLRIKKNFFIDDMVKNIELLYTQIERKKVSK